MWGKNLVNNVVTTPETILQTPDTTTETLKDQGTSTKASDIEADLTATNLEGLDQELNDIEQQLGQ